MKAALLAPVLVLLAACATGAERNATTREQHGREIAQANCSRCHAIGSTGDSPYPEAPPFRTLSRNYRVDNLGEAFAEGISVGHPAMPQFEFDPEDVDDLVAYLTAIQEEPSAN
ncbi:c-type cytochrome [Terricaulis sp.]|uniref:c-type cytochrome n=1 Tax=Terricaulis sp. TaxID=2768686 RepID=UPI003783413F